MLNKIKGNQKVHLTTYTNSDSVISDQFRKIRTNIKFLTNNMQNKVYLLTSTRQKEGKSTVISNLTVSIVQQQSKVLLIDANLREPLVHDIFKISNDKGLTNVLKGYTTLEQAISHTDIQALDILTAGIPVTNPTELLGSEGMKELLLSAASMYDMVLIDSPSVLESTDTRVLANQCAGVVLVINRGKTVVDDVIETKKVLELANANLMGVIFNEK
ncbi:CpsD/CapB family tyrosine-protein kinase [Ornithinibacillus californiensis]|uniref:CpsD/CapB family tyrosine-protein kinase n=1 Tax=Ornithinibacillus californiensis TaxID=161536 RepID=UPI00064DC84C|nr:CpsD/CapB family tyrosine-protein kinase [Ornithinibacillus californiensis]